MPLYEYSCQKCHAVVEKIQKFSDPPLLVCETCGGPLVKLMGKPALQFKGSGFYITVYVKKGESGNTGGGEKKSAAPAPSADSSSSTPAPAAAPPAAPSTPATPTASTGS